MPKAWTIRDLEAGYARVVDSDTLPRLTRTRIYSMIGQSYPATIDVEVSDGRAFTREDRMEVDFICSMKVRVRWSDMGIQAGAERGVLDIVDRDRERVFQNSFSINWRVMAEREPGMAKGMLSESIKRVVERTAAEASVWVTGVVGVPAMLDLERRWAAMTGGVYADKPRGPAAEILQVGRRRVLDPEF